MKRVTSKRNRVELRTSRRRRAERTRAASHSNGTAARKTRGSRHPARKDPHRNHTRVPAEAAVKRHRTDPQYVAAIKSFEAGVRHFNRQRFEKARQIFEKLSSSSYPEVADRARLHLRLCEQRKSRSAPSPKTAQDYYVLGVAELNARQLESAVEHLNRAERLQPNREHIRYALAAAHALQGNTEFALEHLKVAIALRPENSFQARHDEDFTALVPDHRFRTLVGGNGSHAREAGS
jgi:tetratricopeptide (TPR) repeat protein